LTPITPDDILEQIPASSGRIRKHPPESTAMKPATKLLLREALIVMLVFAGYLFAAARFRSQFAPAPHVRTFTDLQRQGVPMTRAVRLPSGTGDVCVFGDVQPLLWTLPSGPPAYHFDASGRLTAFTLDVGDSTRFQEDYDTVHGTEIALSDLPSLFAAHTPQ
jgi:hypothetical protein